MTTADGSNGSGHDALWPLVEALRELSCLAEVGDRNFVVRMLSGMLGAHLPVEEHPIAVRHLYGIVEACRQRPNGLTALREVLDRIEQGSKPMRRVRAIITQMTALEMWPDDERDLLFELLRGVVVPDIGDIYRFVAGPGAPGLLGQTTFPEVFLLLETLNADPDGLPKPLVFVEYLATRVRLDLASELRRWADRQATRFGVVNELQAVRRKFVHVPMPAPPPRSQAYLVLLLQLDGPSGDRFRLSHWTQLDVTQGWYPEHGPDFVGPLDEIKYRVAELAEATEANWAQYEPEICVEFVLSSDLLNLDVDQWQWETDSSVPEPVGCRFPVAIRSLERMKAGKWHRSWRSRWKELNHQLEEDGTIAVESNYCHPARDEDGLRTLTSVFAREGRLVSLVLGEPPAGDGTGRDQVLVGLRAGIPVIFWHRQDCRLAEFTQTVAKLLHEEAPGNVLERVRYVRANAFEGGPDTAHVGNHLTVLWDDPERVVVPRDPAPPEGVVRT
ncbi:effector-associated domain 2-containing protein [Amycolatopsis anabasis]|uniref:VMAP-C domain-containing protein n=1 Tax=Amycolatopsis anabasis TaxID=1840409 RepID=UPI00131AB79A|nr:hypothetical protein [Amycolatopsis anabasis]